MMAAGALLAQAPPEPPKAPRPPRAIAPRVMVAQQGGPYLGIGVADVDSERAKALRLSEERGVEVKSVTPDGPAAKAGIKEADVVLEYNGQRVEGRESLLRMVRETPAGREAKLLVWRNGAAQNVNVMLGTRPRTVVTHLDREFSFEMPEMPDIRIPPIPPLPDMPRSMMSWRSTALGVESESLSSQLAEYFGVKEGVLVRSVVRNSPAEKAGIKAGDVIVKLDGTAVTSPREITSVLRSLRGTKRTLPLVLVRERKEMTVTVTLEETGSQAPKPARAVLLQDGIC
jgi:serine protease Do